MGSRVNYVNYNIIFSRSVRTISGPMPPYIEDSRSHLDKRHSVGILWTSDKPDSA